MPDRTKIATCSYCGARAMLVPTARDGHELACSSCGAPLHEMKWLRAPAAEPPAPRLATPAPYPTHGHKRPAKYADPYYSRRKRKRRKPMWKKALSEAVDLIEDIFD